MKGTALSIVRHAAAVAAAWLATILPLTAEQISDVETGLTAVGVAIMLGIYALGEKLLKPVFYRVFGEVQPGDMPPQAHDIAKIKEGV